MGWLKTSAIVLTLALSGGAAQGQPAAVEKPRTISGPGLHVRNLEAAKTWYVEKLGMRVRQTIDRNGKPFVHILGYEGDAALLALHDSPERPEGLNHNAWVMLLVPNPKALAQQMAAQGIPMREAVPDVSYVIQDPEGNSVELVVMR